MIRNSTTCGSSWVTGIVLGLNELNGGGSITNVNVYKGKPNRQGGPRVLREALIYTRAGSESANSIDWIDQEAGERVTPKQSLFSSPIFSLTNSVTNEIRISARTTSYSSTHSILPLMIFTFSFLTQPAGK
uniref:Uncharacterized protein n=1 Tax=Utricularia reniformis TaxID=192314 RepID=A0A1Y0B4R2_9LAMI|nr:hypothetical protein AEK19_MT2221 [Utricularia reniformis]ART32367.1 hypothetical protein AEK19_MT2221 [Utricularia reniformis]